MAGNGPLERRPAVWPYLVMPLVVLLVFYALRTIHQQPRPAAGAQGPAATAAEGAPGKP